MLGLLCFGFFGGYWRYPGATAGSHAVQSRPPLHERISRPAMKPGFIMRSGVSVAALGAPPRNLEAKAGPGSRRRSALCAVVYVESRAARAGERPVAAVPSTLAALQ